MRAAAPFKREKITYGVGPGNDIRAHNIRSLGREGFSFDLMYHGDAAPVRIRIPGRQNVLNALAASAIALCMNVPLDHIRKGLDRFEGIKGRFELTRLPGGATLVDDTYNANPSSLKASIDSLKDLVANGGRVIVGLGEMMELGDETTSAHLEAGGMVAELDAYYFAALGEHARDMIQGAVSAGFPSERAVLVKNHGEMTDVLKDIMKEGDLIFLKGSRRAGLDRVVEGLKGVMNAI
jgi:UDP-N-acetylmuramoyl-tripeptide--D-alanyl-D-alanine ligase